MSVRRRPGVGEQPNKKQCMIKGTQLVSEEDGDIDRISSLPRKVINCILELMSARDAARTCVLSSKWRYIWANHPTLVLDDNFRYTMDRKRSSKNLPIDFGVNALNRLFLHHTGHINKLVLDISVARPERYSDVDLWVSSLCRRGMKVLSLENSSSIPYTVPSCVFSNSNLTELSISNCILKTSKSSTYLHNLESLDLEDLTLFSGILVTPFLSSLRIESCRGIRGSIICAPKLQSLILYNNDYLRLVPYLTCSNIELVYIYMYKKIEREGDGESINLVNLLSCWPKISTFVLDGSSLKYLTRSICFKEFALMLSLRFFAPYFVKSNLDQIAWILRILQNSPLLHEFEIWFKKDVPNNLEAVNFLEEPNVMNQKMEKLRVVKMIHFSASKAEILFVKILLGSAPTLERMLVEEDEELDPDESLEIAKELMRLPRASPNAEIIFGPELIRKLERDVYDDDSVDSDDE